MAEYGIDGLVFQVPEDVLNDRVAAKLASGGYEAQEAQAARARLREGQRVLELGSGIGYIASLCARITGSRNVITVEANPAMLPVIRGNLDRNGFDAVTLLHGAVVGMTADAAPVAFDKGKSFWAARLAGSQSAGGSVIDVPQLGLGELLETYRPHVVIMDIEGAEERLFDVPWPRFVQAVMMELHPRRYPDTVIRRIVDCMSHSGLTYDTAASCGRILGFRRLRDR